MASPPGAAYASIMQSTLSIKVLCLWALTLTSAAASALHAQAAPTTTSTTQAAAPRVLHLPGIGGYLPIDRHFIRGLRQGGLTDIGHFDWTSGRPGLAALVNNDNKQAQSRALAERLTAEYRADPDRPIHITAHSGGGAIAVWALEQLPDDVTIERLFLLHPALAPSYDLSRALQHVRNRAYVFSSTMDPVLGPGTRALGTMDGVHTDAMGRVGFVIPADADPQQYAKLIAMPYDDRWLRHDNIGDHIGPLTTRFAEAFIAPLIAGEQP